MDSLHEISAELMKPIKNLVDWNFPMSEILDKYNETLDKKPEELKFGEAALVIQNSANIYDKRIELLHNDTLKLNKSFQECEEQNELEKTKTKKERKKRDEFNFDNFEYIDFSKDIGKNINLKNEENHSIELLPSRYPQLEKCPSHNFSINIFDVNGDVIGKKYDYLLNGHVTSSNMLVDELTPEDFTDDDDDYDDDNDDNDNVNYVNIKNQKDEILASSSYCANDYTDDFNDCDVFSPFAESGYETISDTPSSRGNSFNESIRGDDDDDHVFTRSPLTTQLNSRVESEINNLNDKTTISDETILTEATTSTLNLLKNSKTRESFETDAGYTSGDPDDVNQTLPKIINNSDNIENQFKQSTTDPPTDDKIPQNIKELSEKKCTDNLRRSKRQKDKIIISFEPFPVTEIPDVTPKNISNKLASLKTIIQSTKKRKSTVKNIKRKKFKQHIDNSDDNKLNIKNENEQLSTYKLCEKNKKEIKQYEKLLKEKYNDLYVAVGSDDLLGFKLRITESENIKKEIKQYEKLLKEKYNDLYVAVGSDDLLGFKLRITESENIKNKNCLLEKNQSSTLDDPGGDILFKTPGIPCLDDSITQEFNDTISFNDDCISPSPEASCSYTPPLSSPPPDYDDNSDQSDDPGPDEYQDMTLTYEKRIELKMKELQDDFDSKNDRVNETSRWLKTMEILKIAEKRPIFHVHEYGNKIIKNLKRSHENRLSFDDIVTTEEPEDIARLFLASLHLANTHEVDIHVTTNNSLSNVDLRLKSSNSSL
ncbi:hypothetical protein HCN44_009182 [Aphidius gifuensis]|uniref:Condensin-2 complex subunit H2 n=1 Tax=Aphidius gifuensis TaxID=684658 RepID=A0A835CV73_APHGI|nr:protein PFC0760c-like [Aphidius gifuensis]XP_044016250.1 protein PFC0760c-like [Aphidius gifuensis]KAF7997784.1 hypothetical protein HCN44_009182 [Aphidius gifuensis]